MPGIASNQRDMPFFIASGSAVALTAFMMSTISTSSAEVLHFPDSTRAISMMLLTMPRSTLLLSLTSSTRYCSSGGRSFSELCQMSAKAMIEESGVFSSWLTRVRKSVLAALSSSRRAFVSSAGSMPIFSEPTLPTR